MSLIVDFCRDPLIWSTTLQKLGNFDFSHTYEYYQLSTATDAGDPVLAVVRDARNQVYMAWPLFQRIIPGTGHHDFTNAYGYGGPIFAPNADPDHLMALFESHLEQTGAVSLFSRMHPLIHQEFTEKSFLGQRLSNVVVIKIDDQPAPENRYRASHRREIKRSIELGVTTTIDESGESLDVFLSIYYETMRRVSARSSYFFSREYIRAFFDSKSFRTYIITAYFNDNPVSSALFVKTNDIMQYYLSGTLDSFRKIAPSKLIINTAQKLATQLSCKNLILGGGVGSSEDALYKFKAGFSDYELPFYVKKSVYNPEVYRQLCISRGVDPNVDFFPAYRVTA